MGNKQEAENRDYADEIGTISVSLGTAKLIVQLCWHDGHVPLLIGESGTGKTAAIRQLAKVNGMRMLPFHLGNVDSTDIRGPMFPQEGGTFKFLTPGHIPVKWQADLRQTRVLHRYALHGFELEDVLAENFDETLLPEEFTDRDRDTFFSIRRDSVKEEEPAALFFDETNRGSKDAMNAVMSVWQERLLGDAELGDNVRICAAMNPPGGTYSVNAQFSNDPAMRRRVCQIVVEFSRGEFLRYVEDPSKQEEKSRIPELDFKELAARDKNRPYHDSVVAYLRQHPDSMLDTRRREAGKIYGCPPTWEAVSDTMYTLDRLDLAISDTVLRRAITAKLAGHVGYNDASDFIAFHEKQVDVLDPIEVLYNYEPGTPVYKTVQKMLKASEYMALMNVLEASVRYIFDPKEEDFEISDVMPQMGRIINDLPANLAQDLVVHFSTVSEDVHSGFNKEIRVVMNELLKNDEFKEYQARSLKLAKEHQQHT